MDSISIKNRIVALLISVAMIFSIFISIPEKAFADTSIAIVATSNGANVRSGPGTSYGAVTTVAYRETLTVESSTTGSDGYVWYYIRTADGNYGYIRSDLIEIQKDNVYTNDGDFENYMTQEGFPESYKPYLREMHAKYPMWVFRAAKTGLDWNTVVTKESRLGTSLVAGSSIASWKSTAPGAYNYETGKWTSYDTGGWHAASTEIIKYYLDPRNFLNTTGVFQFLTHSFDESTQNVSGLTRVVSGSFMAKSIPEDDGSTYLEYSSYAELLMKAGEISGVNPYVLASMILVEQGTNGRGASISGTVSGYEGYYNYYNIGAYQTASLTAVQKGLNYAASTSSSGSSYMRPWNTRAKSVIGGAQYYYAAYVSKNKNTLYFKKWNVMNGSSMVGNGQYMTNVQGAESEASQLRKGYAGLLDEAMTFVIPVYSNMPKNACPKPTGTTVPPRDTDTTDKPPVDEGNTGETGNETGNVTDNEPDKNTKPEEPKKTNAQLAEEYLSALKISATSKKVSANKISVTINADVEYLKKLGYKVQYIFYRSVKSRSDYVKMMFKINNNTYINSSGVPGTKYYYKAKIQAVDSLGTVVATSALNQCTYATRTFGEVVEIVEKSNDELAAEFLKELNFKATSEKLGPKKIKITANCDTSYLTKLGYKVQYEFLRSETKTSDYRLKSTKEDVNTYTNTSGTVGTKYYYKVVIKAVDEKGKIVASTSLPQCTYASRTFGI